MSRRLLATIIIALAFGNSALASTEECEAAKRRMTDVRDQTVWAARQYANCVESGDAYDDCTTWMIQVRVEHDEFTNQLDYVQRKCQ